MKANIAPSIKKILDNIESPSSHLHHLASELNVSDIGTRPISVKELQEKKEWFEGPAFLLTENIPDFEIDILDNEQKHNNDTCRDELPTIFDTAISLPIADEQETNEK